MCCAQSAVRLVLPGPTLARQQLPHGHDAPPHRLVPPADQGDGPQCPASAALPHAVSSSAPAPGTSGFLSKCKPHLPRFGSTRHSGTSQPLRRAVRWGPGTPPESESFQQLPPTGSARQRPLTASGFSCLSPCPGPVAPIPRQPPAGPGPVLPSTPSSWGDPWLTSRANGRMHRPVALAPRRRAKPPCSAPGPTTDQLLPQPQPQARSPSPLPGLAVPARPRTP